MNVRNVLKLTDLDVIAGMLTQHARWLLSIRKELLELAEEGSHEGEAHEVRKRIKAILMPPEPDDPRDHPQDCQCENCGTFHVPF